MKYDAFTGDITGEQLADTLLSELSDEFGVISDINGATEAITGFISELQSSDTSWVDVATHTADLAAILISYVPAGRVADLAASLYSYGGLL